ncbi:MAG: hypothetical protein LBH32_15225 [Dysgonamonadaceae bacterium]|jgi:YegS/Rv2252/BmrU family lipid kinase|nr:hypothetical protein [Dysgonamonadaceae bacterium]
MSNRKIKQLNVLSVDWQVIINPNAYSGKGMKCRYDITQILTEKKIRFQEHISHSAIDSLSIVKKLCKNGSRYFIFLGGDGTANMIVNGIFSSGADANRVFIVPIPVGTGNDWTHTHNYPADYHRIIDHFLKGNFALHDVGLVECYRGKNLKEARFFINIAGFGFDAAVIKKTINGKKTLLTSATYLWNLLKVLFSYKTGTVAVSSPEIHIDEAVFNVAVGICRYNGNGMKQVPSADPFDGLFDVVLIRKISFFKVIANVRNLFSGTHIRMREVVTFKTQSLEIHSDPYTLGEVEGEMLAEGNYKISMSAQKLNVLMICY